MTVEPDAVDPANGTEPVVDELRQLAQDYGIELYEPATFTAPEKLTSVVQAVLASPSADPKMRGLLAALTSGLGRRLILQPMLDLLPPLDEPEEWDAWLELLVGVAFELTSDNVIVDVDQAREKARFLFSALFEGAG